jgi:hypothetical protein
MCRLARSSTSDEGTSQCQPLVLEPLKPAAAASLILLRPLLERRHIAQRTGLLPGVLQLRRVSVTNSLRAATYD